MKRIVLIALILGYATVSVAQSGPGCSSGAVQVNVGGAFSCIPGFTANGTTVIVPALTDSSGAVFESYIENIPRAEYDPQNQKYAGGLSAVETPSQMTATMTAVTQDAYCETGGGHIIVPWTIPLVLASPGVPIYTKEYLDCSVHNQYGGCAVSISGGGTAPFYTAATQGFTWTGATTAYCTHGATITPTGAEAIIQNFSFNGGGPNAGSNDQGVAIYDSQVYLTHNSFGGNTSFGGACIYNTGTDNWTDDNYVQNCNSYYWELGNVSSTPIAAVELFGTDQHLDRNEITDGSGLYLGHHVSFTQSGTISVSGTAVTGAGTPSFIGIPDSSFFGIVVGGVETDYTVLTVNSATSITLTTSAGTHTNVTYYAAPSIGALTGTVSTSGGAVTLGSGSTFTTLSANQPITINSVTYTIQTINSSTSLTLTASAGTQSNVAYYATPNAGAYITSAQNLACVAVSGGNDKVVDNLLQLCNVGIQNIGGSAATGELDNRFDGMSNAAIINNSVVATTIGSRFLYDCLDALVTNCNLYFNGGYSHGSVLAGSIFGLENGQFGISHISALYNDSGYGDVFSGNERLAGQTYAGSGLLPEIVLASGGTADIDASGATQTCASSSGQPNVNDIASLTFTDSSACTVTTFHQGVLGQRIQVFGGNSRVTITGHPASSGSVYGTLTIHTCDGLNLNLGQVQGSVVFDVENNMIQQECSPFNGGSIDYALFAPSVTAPQFLSTPYTITSSATPAIVITKGQIQQITLSANATATVSGVSAGAQITLHICQPSSGGPYTFASSGLSGLGTIGVTAGECSNQTFTSFNGTTVVATGPMIVNVAP